MRWVRHIGRLLILWLIGGVIYYGIEILYRRYSHPAMIVVGGLCFVLVGLINEILTWGMSIWFQMGIATIIVTIVELIAGFILNIWLGLNIWDYSNLAYNIAGQVCLLFSGAWYILSGLGIVIDDWLRHWLFDEEKPHYNFKLNRV